ncbi:hypothetical protein OQA88_1351 [Cercophora sp. LCS_1]
MTKSIAIITTSTRNPRVGPHVSALIQTLLQTPATTADITLVPVDLATFRLPLYDELIIPGMINPTDSNSPQYVNAASIAWSTEIKRHDGYILVIPEYNYGLAGATKNAIDYLMHEWKGKPVAVVSYGIAGGSFASEQAAHVLGKMGLRVAGTRPKLGFAGGNGPDLVAAMIKGELGEESRTKWEGEGDVRKAFEELRGLLEG